MGHVPQPSATKRTQLRHQADLCHAVMAEMVRAMVLAEWPKGRVETVPVAKGTVKLLMQPRKG